MTRFAVWFEECVYVEADCKADAKKKGAEILSDMAKDTENLCAYEKEVARK